VHKRAENDKRFLHGKIGVFAATIVLSPTDTSLARRKENVGACEPCSFRPRAMLHCTDTLISMSINPGLTQCSKQQLQSNT
jgi:hypothetical protein